MLERLGNIGLQLLVVLLVVIGLWIFKSMVFGSFEITASLGFIVTAFFIAGIVMVILSAFATEAIAKKLTNAVLVILVLAAGWSILVNTNEVAAEANKDTASGLYVKLSSSIWPANAKNDEAKLQADRECDEVTAKFRAYAEQQSKETFEKDFDLEAYLKRRESIQKSMDSTVRCKTTSPNSSTSSVLTQVQRSVESSSQSVSTPSTPTYGLEFRKAYKYDNSPKVYVYDTDGKLHWLTSEMAFLNYYGCRYQPGVHINKCMTIYRMPSGVPKSMFGSDIN